jgi:hypothetical protein
MWGIQFKELLNQPLAMTSGLQSGDWLEFRRFCETSCLSRKWPVTG